MYCPRVEVAKSCCRKIKKGCEANCSPCYFLSFVEEDEEISTSKSNELHVVVQMDTENPVYTRRHVLTIISINLFE
ncbi:hypothetical protein DITRI_Ditri09bG0052400 [Diplodiscus trichospermus]